CGRSGACQLRPGLRVSAGAGGNPTGGRCLRACCSASSGTRRPASRLLATQDDATAPPGPVTEWLMQPSASLAGCAGRKSADGDAPRVLERGPGFEGVPPVDSVVQQ